MRRSDSEEDKNECHRSTQVSKKPHLRRSDSSRRGAPKLLPYQQHWRVGRGGRVEHEVRALLAEPALYC